MLSDCFPEALAFIRDPSPFKASFCTRRAAKSYSVGLEFIHDSYDYPRAHYLFLMTVRGQAKRDFWEDVLKAIDHKHQLGMKFNESDLIATMPNGAKIYVGGADSSKEEWRKLIAGKYRKVHIDEAQAFIHADLRTLAYESFKPAVADLRGSIGMSGTPGMVNKGLFFEVTHGLESGWSLHKWRTEANPFMRVQWAAEIADLKARKPGVETTPWFRRNYLAEWVIEDTALVYRYAIGRNDFIVLPVYPQGEWHYILACDLGYNDPTSLSVLSYHDNDQRLYVLESVKESGLDVTAVAIRTKALMRKYDFDAMVIDNANKQAVEEMVRRHEIPWQPANKTGKSDFIELMNAEFLTGRILLGPECNALREEYASLVWEDPKAVKREEHPACDNHCTDGALYGWRHCFPYLSQEIEVAPEAGTPAAQQREVDEMREEALRRHQPREWEPGEPEWRPE